MDGVVDVCHSTVVSLYRYSRWDGSQQLPAVDADDVLRALSEDVLAEGDIRRALQRLMQRGMRGTRGGDIPGLRRIMEDLRRRRQEELERSNLGGVLGQIEERLQGIIDTERARDRPAPRRGGTDGARCPAR